MCALVALLNVWINILGIWKVGPTRTPVRRFARYGFWALSSPRIPSAAMWLFRKFPEKKKIADKQTQNNSGRNAKSRKYGDCIKSKSHTETHPRNRTARRNMRGKFEKPRILIHTFNNLTSPHIRATHSMIIFGTHGDLATGRMGKRSDGTRLNAISRAICAPYNRSFAELHGFPRRMPKRLCGAAIGKSHMQMLFHFEQSKRNVWNFWVASPKEHSTSDTQRAECRNEEKPRHCCRGFAFRLKLIKYRRLALHS